MVAEKLCCLCPLDTLAISMYSCVYIENLGKIFPCVDWRSGELIVGVQLWECGEPAETEQKVNSSSPSHYFRRFLTLGLANPNSSPVEVYYLFGLGDDTRPSDKITIRRV